MFLQSPARDLLIRRHVAVDSAKPHGYPLSRCPRLFCGTDNDADGLPSRHWDEVVDARTGW
jgi:hypothetical protein